MSHPVYVRLNVWFSTVSVTGEGNDDKYGKCQQEDVYH